MQKKAKAKKPPAPKKTQKKARPKKDDFAAEPPPMIGLSELAALADCSHDVIRNCGRDDPNAPAHIGGKYHRIGWLNYLKARKLFGPKWWALMDAEERGQAITGMVEPMSGPPVLVGPPIPAPPPAASAALDLSDGSASVATAELMRLSPDKLLKAKMAEELISRRLMNQERKRILIKRSDVEEALFSRGQKIHALARQFTLEIVPKLVGLDRPEMEMASQDFFDAFLREAAAVGDKIRKEELTEAASKPPEINESAKPNRGN